MRSPRGVYAASVQSVARGNVPAWATALPANRQLRGKRGNERDNMHGPCSDVRRVDARDYRASTAIARLWANASAYIGRKTRSANCAGGARMPGGDGARERKRNYWRWGVGRWGGRQGHVPCRGACMPSGRRSCRTRLDLLRGTIRCRRFRNCRNGRCGRGGPSGGSLWPSKEDPRRLFGCCFEKTELGRTLAHHLSLS